MIETPIAPATRRVIFGQLPESPGVMPHASGLSCLGRDLFIDTFYNVSKFEQEGLRMQTAWSTRSTQTPGRDGGRTPNEGFGNARYFQHDIAEAKKLLSAAGHPSGVEAHFRYAISGHPYGVEYNKSIEVIAGMIPDAGFKHKFTEMNFAGEFRGVVQNGGGKFDGLSFINSFSVPDPSDFFFRFYNSKGATFYGYDAEAKATAPATPRWTR
jgi:ABC-type transport system substrate-binding protein